MIIVLYCHPHKSYPIWVNVFQNLKGFYYVHWKLFFHYPLFKMKLMRSADAFSVCGTTFLFLCIHAFTFASTFCKTKTSWSLLLVLQFMRGHCCYMPNVFAWNSDNCIFAMIFTVLDGCLVLSVMLLFLERTKKWWENSRSNTSYWLKMWSSS